VLAFGENGGDQQHPQMSREALPGLPAAARLDSFFLSEVITTSTFCLFVTCSQRSTSPSLLQHIPDSLIRPDCQPVRGRDIRSPSSDVTFAPVSTPAHDSAACSTLDMGSIELLGMAGMVLSTSDVVLSTSCVLVRYRRYLSRLHALPSFKTVSLNGARLSRMTRQGLGTLIPCRQWTECRLLR
jgi:hypothetical protein